MPRALRAASRGLLSAATAGLVAAAALPLVPGALTPLPEEWAVLDLPEEVAVADGEPAAEPGDTEDLQGPRGAADLEPGEDLEAATLASVTSALPEGLPAHRRSSKAPRAPRRPSLRHRSGRGVGASVWIPSWSAGASVASASRNAGQVRVASPFWYTTGAAGTVASAGGRPLPVATLRRAGLTVVPTVIDSLGPAAMAPRLSDPRWRSTLAASLVDTVARSGADGIDLDFEHLAGGSRADACAIGAGYAALVETVAAQLHAKGKVLVVTVMPRTYMPAPCPSGSPPTYDLRRIGRAADLVRVMAYDHATAATAPGPLAPLRWVEQVVAATVRQVPASKLELGVATYARTWAQVPAKGKVPARRTSEALSWAEAAALAGRARTTNTWDHAAGERVLRRTDPDGTLTTTWVADAGSVAARAALARRYGLAGVAVWSVGHEDPATWARLARG